MSVNNIGKNGPKQPLDSAKLQQQATASQNQTPLASVAKDQVSAGQDSVSLNQTVQQLAQAPKKGDSAPVNQEKVAQLKKAIINGEYKVNPEALAQKIAKLESDIYGL
jgi:negative regulator of flagellin synthesis FlgM